MSEELSTRCLNALRKQHSPSYVAMRILADSIVSNDNSSYALRSVLRRFNAQSPTTFKKVLRFKGMGDSGKPKYRELYFPSPFACLAEAVVLSHIARMPSFKQHPNVYSYRWPDEAYEGHNFNPYFDYYQKRNQEIYACLSKLPNEGALILDIKDFYPSIPHTHVRDALYKRLSLTNLEPDVRVAVEKCAESTLSYAKGEVGVPIGPEISHLLADMVLRNLDEEMTLHYDWKYFRYVDDIVIIVPESEQATAKDRVKALLSTISLSLNEDKSDFISSKVWLEFGPDGLDSVSEESWEALTFRLKSYMARHKNSDSRLKLALESKGVYMPIDKLRMWNELDGYFKLMQAFVIKGWLPSVQSLTDTPEKLALRAVSVRDSLNKNLNECLSRAFPDNPTCQKWRTQALRRNSNRLLYLESNAGLSNLRAKLVGNPDLAELNFVMDAVVQGKFDGLLTAPGSSISAFCSVRRCRNLEKIKLSSEFIADEVSQEVLAQLLVHDGVDLGGPISLQPQLEDHLYLEFCAGNRARTRELDDFGYVDEIRCLQMSPKAQLPPTILETKLLDGESFVYDALELGSESRS